MFGACPEAGTYMLARDGWCAQRDHKGEEAGADEEHDGEVEVVHAAEERWAR